MNPLLVIAIVVLAVLYAFAWHDQSSRS